MRTYLDHNATTPLRTEARRAMETAMDVMGNPSSVHAEGRKAKMLVEAARVQVAELVGCLPTQVIFTSSATEAAALAVAQKHRHGGIFAALPTEHDCLGVWSEVAVASPYDAAGVWSDAPLVDTKAGYLAISAANSETGVLYPGGTVPGRRPAFAVVADITQAAGKLPIVYGETRPHYMILSAHKLGGPKGIGALINFTADDPEPILRGGGQEMNRRSGTENLVGIAGFGAAAAAAAQDVAQGRWAEIAEFRNILETALEAGRKKTIFVGKETERLPNTCCVIAEGWKGETQVMQMDLAGFAISAGSACSSGKVKASTVLQAMGYEAAQAACAVRISLGLETTKEEVLRFADRWCAGREKHAGRTA